MQIENETYILGKIFKTLYSTQLFKIWTLFFRDNVTGHTLVALGKGREVPELCRRGSECSRFAAAVAHMLARVFACVSCLLRTKMHMGFLLRQYRCPLATRVVSEKGSHVARPQR